MFKLIHITAFKLELFWQIANEYIFSTQDNTKGILLFKGN